MKTKQAKLNRAITNAFCHTDEAFEVIPIEKFPTIQNKNLKDPASYL